MEVKATVVLVDVVVTAAVDGTDVSVNPLPLSVVASEPIVVCEVTPTVEAVTVAVVGLGVTSVVDDGADVSVPPLPPSVVTSA